MDQSKNVLKQEIQYIELQCSSVRQRDIGMLIVKYDFFGAVLILLDFKLTIF